MLNPEERYNIWQGYKERAAKFLSDVEDDLEYKYAPYRKSEADKDVPAVRRLFGMLAEISAYLERHAEELDAEYSDFEDEQVNLRDFYDAWELSLCPVVMRESRIANFPFGKGYAWKNIARFKEERGISRTDTEQAISLWRMARKLEAAGA